jgi:glutamate-ammonia-ligase adenylyltransferase
MWQQATSEDQILQRLHTLGYQQPEDMAGKLQAFYSSRAVEALQAVPRGRLDALMPKLLDVCVKRSDNSITLARVLRLIQAVLRRSAYLALLVENPQALEQLALLCERSSWVADELAAYPALLDELLDSRNLYRILDKPALRDQLHQQMLRVDSGDQEQQMEAIRYFCRSYTLRVAACEVMDLLPLMQVSDYLTWIAEVVLEHVTDVAWHQLTTTYGSPSPNPDSDIDSRTPGFIVVAYGKMGGIELGYRSDLDLVFLHNALASHQTDGARQIDSSTFFMRLGQRIIHLLSTSTASGIAYEIDTRLRPSGSSGMLVSTLTAFQKYQQQDAWTWEHQALVRSRVVAGDRKLAAEFNKVRELVLRQPRDAQSLATEVQKMREKMRKHLDQSTKDGKFSLKQGTGGIVDIEFMVQFTVLAWSHAHPLLCRWSDNIRILESLAQCGLFTDEESLQLIDAYKNLRTAGHRLQLQKQLDEVPLSAFVVQREIVKTRWNCLMDNN